MRIFFRNAVLFIFPIFGYGQSGVNGFISTNDGDTLPFVSVLVRDLSVGVTSNEEGFYSLKLKPGDYVLEFRYLGYKPVFTEVEVQENQFINLNITLSPQGIQLREAQVLAGNEDPALRIMRMAIASSTYHRLKYNAYSCNVYTKGTYQMFKIPSFLKSIAEAQNHTTEDMFTMESIHEIKFSQPPPKVEEKTIAHRSADEFSVFIDDFFFSIINLNFYRADMEGLVSPLSPAAFYYYNFKYLGGFEENELWVNKIKVEPKSKGEGLFTGTIYIIENEWAIHSLQLEAFIGMGVLFKVEQLFSLINDEIRMPVKQKISFDWSILGVKNRNEYLAIIRDYEIDINTDIQLPDLVDAKTEEKIEKVKVENKKQTESFTEVFTEEEKIDRKQFRKLMKQYEKARSIEEDVDRSVQKEYVRKSDSAAYKRDSLFWEENRPIPLTDSERKTKVKMDSVREADKDTSSYSTYYNPDSRFAIQDFFIGGRYIKNRTQIRLFPMITEINFNTVEGLTLQSRLRYERPLDTVGYWNMEVMPVLRYATARETFYPAAQLRIFKREKHFLSEKREFLIKGGKQAVQYNDGVINPWVNLLHSLFLRENFMKLYQKEFVEFAYHEQFDSKWEIGVKAEYAQRRPLLNQSDYSFFFRDSRDYSSNMPALREGNASDLMYNHHVVKGQISLKFRPGLKYSIDNGVRKPLLHSAPEFGMVFDKGMYSDRNGFDHLQLQYKQRFRFGISGFLEVASKAGTFFNTNPLLPDLMHFDGNQSFFARSPLEGFSFLDYYSHSTARPYIQVLSNYTFRKFFVSQLPVIRILGLKEHLFLNYLNTTAEGSEPYTEIGYGLGGLFKVFRFETGARFLGDQYDGFYFRVGLNLVFR